MNKDNVATILDKIEESSMKDIHFSQFARDLLSNLKEKQQKVILKRFGLSGRKKTTLEAIGREFGVTRERVRQIEAASIVKLRKIAKLNHNKATFDNIKNIIEAKGGVLDEASLVEALISDLEDKRRDEIKKILRFVMLLSEDLQIIEATEYTKSGWALARYTKEMFHELGKAFSDVLEVQGDVLEDEILLEKTLKHEISDKYKEEINPKFLLSAVELASKLHKTEDGKRGLAHWPWIKPKTVRDKIFFVLSKKGDPMHFNEISEAIIEASFDNKKATVQTIHNELISDSRFVLVGRGLYALSNWGFEKGTVEEVIEKILKKNSPMEQNSIVEEVLGKKRVKKTTILINLQSSQKFRKTEEGYILN